MAGERPLKSTFEMKHREIMIGAVPNPSRLKVERELMGRFLRAALLLTLLFAFVFVPRNPAQHTGGSSGSSMGSATQNAGGLSTMDQDPIFDKRTTPGTAEDPIMYERRMKALNAQRQKSMVDDTNKLLKLVTELNDEVNGDHRKPLNADQLRKVAAIEKLARSVREKMSTAVGSRTVLASPFPIPINAIPQ